MTVIPLPKAGNSSKFQVTTASRGGFVLAISYTLRSKIWQLPDDAAELAAAQQMAEAIVARHNPAVAFKDKYIFAEHNAAATLKDMVKELHRSSL